MTEAAQDASLTPEERSRGRQFSQALSMPVLSRAWQLLLKGLREVKDLPRPLAAADMVLVRIGFAADLPTPDEALRKLEPLGQQRAAASRAARRRSGARGPVAVCDVQRAGACARPAAGGDAPSVTLARFEDVVALAGQHRDIQMKLALERDVRLVRFEQGQIEFSLAPGGFAAACANARAPFAGMDRAPAGWSRSQTRKAQPSLKEQEDAKAREALSGVRAEPLVQSVLAAFPGAEIVAVRAAGPALEENPAAATDAGTNDEIVFNDGIYTEDEL